MHEREMKRRRQAGKEKEVEGRRDRDGRTKGWRPGGTDGRMERRKEAAADLKHE